MANPRWYALAQELLYKDLCLFPASLTQFLRTVLTPGCDILASHVQTLTVTWQSFYADPIDPIDLPIFRIAIQNLGLTNPLTLTNDHVALLLHLLPHVRELHLWPPDSPSTHNDYLVATNGTLPLALRSVRHLSCTWVSNHRGVTRDMLLTILTCQTLKQLRCTSSTRSTTPILWQRMRPRLSRRSISRTVRSRFRLLHISYWSHVH